MMHPKETHANGHLHKGKKVVSLGNSHSHNHKSGHNTASAPIPAQKSRFRKQSTNESDDSNDSFSNDGTPKGHSPVTAFSRSLSSSNTGHSLNVYSMSPRSTSVMYQYYSTPKGYYQNQVPLIHTAKSNGHYCTDEHASTRLRLRPSGRARTTSECCESPPKSTPLSHRGIPLTLSNEIMEDPRRRAWSESDSNKKSSLHNSRLSALKRIKKKLGRSSSLKKKRDDSQANDSLNHSLASNNSLEKVEEGRQLLCNQAASPSSSKRSTMTEETIDISGLSLHQEDETVKSSTNSDYHRHDQKERTRYPSTESVFNHEADLIYQRFLEEHTCYDIMPTSCKLVVFDTRLQARKAFHALIANAVRSAPLWDSQVCCYVGVLTVTDFIKVILTTYRANKGHVISVEEQTIESWRKLLNQKCSFANVHPNDSLLDSLKVLINEHFHGVPIMDEESGDIFHIIDYKRILRFLHLFMNELPKPSFMKKTLGETGIGTFDDVATVTKCTTLLDVLELIVNRKVTAIPVVDEDGEVTDVFCKLDMISLAAQGLYHDLTMTVEIALANRFTPLFEDEDCPADAFSRFSSPKPRRRDIPLKNGHGSGTDTNQSLTAFLDEYTKTDRVTNKGHSALAGHSVTRAKSDKVSEPARHSNDNTQSHSNPNRPQQIQLSESITPECTGHHRIRHQPLSNPLVKCRLTDKLQHIIDLMVSTDANVLVVIGQSSNHVVGVVTVSDVLNFIVNPSGHLISRDSPTHIHQRRSRHQFSSTSSGFGSLPSVQDAPETSSVDDLPSDSYAPLFGSDSDNTSRSSQPSSKLTQSSDTCASSDSGYTSTSNLKKDLHIADPASVKQERLNHINTERINPRFLRQGAEMERA